MFLNLISSILVKSSARCPNVGRHSTDYLTIHFVSSKIFMFADIQMKLLRKRMQKTNGAIWASQFA